MTVLLGRTSASTTADFVGAGHPAAWKFTASASGTLATIFAQFKVANATLTSVELGVYADSAGNPGALLATGTTTTGITGTAVFSVTGLSASIVASTQYWLGIRGVGEQVDFQGDSIASTYLEDNTNRALQNPWLTAGNTAGNVGIVIWGEDASGAALLADPLVQWNELGPSADFGPDPFNEAVNTTPAAATSLALDASGGTATAGGGSDTLAFTYAPGSGTATAGGSTSTFSDGLAAASGAATAGGGTVGLSFGYAAGGGGATAGGGADTLTFVLPAAGGTATAGGGADTDAFTFSAASGTATAGGGTDALTFVYGVAAGGSTAGGGDATASGGGGANVSAGGGTASADGGTVDLSIVAFPPPAPVVTGPTGGRYEPGGDESSIYGRSTRVVSTRGHGYGWGRGARIVVRSRPRIRVKLPSFHRPRRDVAIVSTQGGGSGWGSPTRLRVSCRVVSTQGSGGGRGGEGRVLTMDGSHETEDVLALSLLGVL